MIVWTWIWTCVEEWGVSIFIISPYFKWLYTFSISLCSSLHLNVCMFCCKHMCTYIFSICFLFFLLSHSIGHIHLFSPRSVLCTLLPIPLKHLFPLSLTQFLYHNRSLALPSSNPSQYHWPSVLHTHPLCIQSTLTIFMTFFRQPSPVFYTKLYLLIVIHIDLFLISKFLLLWIFPSA